MNAKSYHVAVIPGDGIGPEVMDAGVAVLEATGVPLIVKRYEAGDVCLAKCGEALPQETLNQQIVTLTSYRKSLIHECVTGQRRISEGDLNRVAGHEGKRQGIFL